MLNQIVVQARRGWSAQVLEARVLESSTHT